MFYGLCLESGIDPGLGYCGVSYLGLVEQLYSDVVVGEVGRADDHCEDDAEGVGEDAAFPCDDLLFSVYALIYCGYFGGGFDALGVEDRRGGLWVAALLDADEPC